MKTLTKSFVVEAALAALFAVTTVSALAADAPAADAKAKAKAEKKAAKAAAKKATSETVHCLGVNSCKGKSECAVEGAAACKGQNACKGKGWISLTTKSCTKKKGTVMAAKAAAPTTTAKPQ